MTFNPNDSSSDSGPDETPMSRAELDRDMGSASAGEIVLDLVDHIDAMVAYWDKNQVCLFANNAYLQWFGKTKDQVMGSTMTELLGPLYPLNLPYIQRVLQGQRQVFERSIPRPQGGIRHSLATYIPDVANGVVRGFFVHVADVTPLKNLEEELRNAKAKAETLATHDFLTGLPNRVLLLSSIAQAIGVAKRRNQLVAVMSLDLDKFKMVNDTYGHGGGDKLLIEIAGRVSSTLRETDMLTRMGGDEFLILAPDIDSVPQIDSMANRVLESVRRPFLLSNATISPSCSLGIACFPDDGNTPDELIEASDRALYKSKSLGKNCHSFVS